MKGITVRIGVFAKIFTLFLAALLLSNSSVKAQLTGGNTYPINGTQNAPTSFGTVADAFNYLNANGTSGTGTVTLEIASGYAGESGLIPALTAYTGMEASRPIVLKPASGQTPTISTSTTTAHSGVIRFNGAKYFTIDGSNNGTNSRDLTITTGSTTTTIRLVDLIPTATSSCKFITVKNVNLRGNSTATTIYTYAAIYLGSGTASPGAALLIGNDSNLFQNNVIVAVRNGIYLRGTNTAGQYDKYNRVLANTIGGTIAPGGSQPTTFIGGVATTNGIYFNSQQDGVIEANTVRNSHTGFYYARGINLDALTAAGAANKDIVINANRIYNLVYSGTAGYANHGMRLQTNNNTANNILVTNNVIANIAADCDNFTSVFDYGLAGIQLASNAGSTNSNVGVTIYHNSINLYDNGSQKMLTRTNLIAACIAMQTNVAGGVQVVNNILSNSYPGSGTTNAKTLAYLIQNGTINPMIPANNGSSKNNALFVNGSNTVNLFGRLANTDYSTFSTWQGNLIDSNSKNVYPDFLDEITLYTFNFDLNNAGTPVGISNDIDNNSRSLTTPDIGASEYTPVTDNLLLVNITGVNSGCNLSTKTPGLEVKNVGRNPVIVGDTLPFWYRINSGAKVWDTLFVSTQIDTGSTVMLSFSQPYNFSTLGGYAIDAGIEYKKDQYRNNDSTSVAITNFNCLNTNPYVTDFETGDFGYTGTGGWTRGVPAKTNINTAGSGQTAWVVEGLSGQYSNNMSAYLTSPLFDFTTACQPQMTWLMRYNTENNYDALILEATTDNVNWVKVTAVTPAYTSTSGNGPVPPPKWSGNNTSWQKYTADLSAFANAPLLRFRFLFGSDGSVTGYDGAAIDSISVEFYPPLGNLSVLSGIQNDTGFVQAPYTFTSSAKGKDGITHYWYVDNALVDSVNGDYSITWTSAGTHEIKYIGKSCAESDTVTIPITIVMPVGKPTIDFIASRYTANAGENIKITSLTGNGAFSWEWLITPDIGYDYISQIPAQNYSFVPPTSTTTPDADLFFLLGDVYDVCLVVQNVNGYDTLCKKEYIESFNAYDACGYSSVPAPKGKVFDSGLGANYSNNENCTSTIEPECADTIFLKLNALATEANADYLRIYDGDDVTGKPMWDINQYPNGLSGNLSNIINLPATMMATNGYVTVRFTSNGTNVAPGFELVYWTKTATSGPNASFTMADTLCPTVNVNAKNTTTVQGSAIYYWDFDGDNIDDYTGQNPSFQYASAGNYTVRLIVENCVGADTAFKAVVVQNPTAKPSTNFAADFTNPAVGDKVTLSNTTTGCVQGFVWTISPNTFSYVNGTSSSSMEPEVIFNAAGCYDVTLITWNGIDYDTLERTCYINAKTMCVPFVSQTNADIGISRLELNTINNQSDAGLTAYTNYTNVYSTVLVKGQTYELTMERATLINSMSRKAWIDFDQDGTFNASEMVAFEPQSLTQQFKANIKIPRTASSGYTRLRVGAVFSNGALNPCGSNFIGEYEDYRIILIADTVRPVITLLGTTPMNIERGRGYTEDGATAADNVDGNITGNIIITGTVDTMAVGVYTISYDVTDSAGNVAFTVARTVNITPDITKPDMMVTGKEYDTIVLNDSYVDLGATANDIVDGNLDTTVTVLSNNLDSSKTGNYTIVYTVTDLSGNTAIITRYVTVIDTTAPVIVLVGNNPLYWPVFTSYVDPGHTVIDYDTLTATITGTVNINVTGSYTLYFDAVDKSGDSAVTVTREVIVYDSIKPIVTLIGPSTVTIDVFTSYYEFGATTSDNYDMSLPAFVISGNLDTAVVGDYELVYLVTDSENNTSDTVIRTVKVVDRVAPEIIVHNPIVIQRTQPKPSLADSVDYTDNYYQKADLTLTINESIDVNVEGYYTVEYTVSDPSGNTSQVAKGLVIVSRATGILPAVVNDAAVNVYPNPAGNKAFVSMNFIRESTAKITVYNITGQKVLEVAPEGKFMTNVVELNLDNLQSGNYFVRVEGIDGVVTKKLTVTK